MKLIILAIIILITTSYLLYSNIKYFFKEFKDFKQWLKDRRKER